MPGFCAMISCSVMRGGAGLAVSDGFLMRSEDGVGDGSASAGAVRGAVSRRRLGTEPLESPAGGAALGLPDIA
jgi:hypothetical protein